MAAAIYVNNVNIKTIFWLLMTHVAPEENVYVCVMYYVCLWFCLFACCAFASICGVNKLFHKAIEV